jgi:hypothetical protein
MHLGKISNAMLAGASCYLDWVVIELPNTASVLSNGGHLAVHSTYWGRPVHLESDGERPPVRGSCRTWADCLPCPQQVLDGHVACMQICLVLQQGPHWGLPAGNWAP